MDTPEDYFKHNGFKEIDDELLTLLQRQAQRFYENAPFKTNKSNCVIVYKKDDTLVVNIKRNYETALSAAKGLMLESTNSIIFSFKKYPKYIKHHIVDTPEETFREKNIDSENNRVTIQDVSNIDAEEPPSFTE